MLMVARRRFALYRDRMTAQPPCLTTSARHSRRTLVGAGIAVLLPGLARAGKAARQVAPPLTLSALFPESGAQALVGDEAWRGVALAVDAANRHRTRQIRLIRTDAVDPGRAIARQVKSDAPTAFIGTLSSSWSFEATAAAELANIPYIELDAPADAITTRGFKMLLRTGLTTTDLAGAATTAIVGQIAPAWRRPAETMRIALLFDDGATDGAFAAAMLGVAQASKLPVLLSMGYAGATMDLTSEVGRMKRAKIDLLIHAGRTEHVLLLYEAMASAAWRPRMILGAGPGYGLSAIGFALGRMLDNTMVVDAPLYATTGRAAAIAAAYRRRYAISPRSSASLTTYVGTELILRSLHPDKPLTPPTLRRGTLANGWGATFDSSGQNRSSFATLQQWRTGRLVTIDPAIPGALRPMLSL